jgi:hypothetical protein
MGAGLAGSERQRGRRGFDFIERPHLFAAIIHRAVVVAVDGIMTSLVSLISSVESS